MARMILSDQEKIAILNEERGIPDGRDCLLIQELRNLHLSDSQIVAIVGVFANICHHCWDAREVCHCENDE